MALESEKPKSTLAPDDYFKLYHTMIEDRKAREDGKKESRREELALVMNAHMG